MTFFPQETKVVGTHQKHLANALLMSAHTSFLWRNKKAINQDNPWKLLISLLQN